VKFDSLPPDLREIAERYRCTRHSRVDWAIEYRTTDLPLNFWRFLEKGFFDNARNFYDKHQKKQKAA